MFPPRTEDFRSRFAGVARLYGAEAFEKIASARVCLVGLGGVGSWTCEALARCGICEITLVDADEICATNTNRQLHALGENYGRAKADVLAERVRAINPACRVRAVKIFLDSENVGEFFRKIAEETACGTDGNARGADGLTRSRASENDGNEVPAAGGGGGSGFGRDFGSAAIVVDAIDGARNKAALIAACVASGTKIVSSGGCAGRCDATRIGRADLSEAQGDALLRIVRRELRAHFGFPNGISGKKFGVPVVFSREVPRAPAELDDAAFPQMISPAGGKPRAGTAAFVTGAFGLALAQLVVEKILEG